ncbi:angiotensin-converting enzyme-like [Anastrepha ludens]|uniref:angiotensin-converting enzyme-like n=1 Tax=Anastrepha ludens TaxID=28586 RepID=UPI0023B11705|nr:angiotensin-converting enzyme-like [Anastrepha ludens]
MKHINSVARGHSCLPKVAFTFVSLLLPFAILLGQPTTIHTAATAKATASAVVTSSNATVKAKYPHAAIYEAHANQFLDKASARMQSIWTRRRNSFFSLTTKGRGYNAINQAPIKQEIENDYRHLVYSLAMNLSTIPVMQLSDPILRRRVKRLAKLQLYGLTDEDYEEAKDLLHTMQTFITSRMVCSLDDCQQTVSMVPTILNHVVRTKNLGDLEYFWRQWRSVLAEHDRAKSAFISYVRKLRLAASYNGHITPSRTWYLYYDTDNFQRELEDVVWEIMPLYQELHAYLLKSVRNTYGEKLHADDGVIPAHVFEQIVRQAWSPRTVFRTPYPKNQLPTVQQRLEEILVTSLKIIKKAAEFFESIGLNHMSDSFYERFSRRIGDEELGPDCRAEVFYFPPEAALRYCPKLDYKKLMQIHGNMAELQYNLYRGRLPYGVDSEPCPGFASALGEAAVIASGTPRHLNRLHILFNHSLNEEQSMNRLFRMGIHTILAIPQYFINDKFLVDVMDGHIGAQDLNCGYWKLQNKYAGVVPPLRRNEKTFDPDFKFYRGLNPEKPNTVKLISEILGYQFYRAFCLASEQYKPGDPEYPLHNCDFYGSEAAGDLMKELMQAGATKHWRDLMERTIGERKLSAKGVMEYFAPLYTWLKEQNKKNDVETGWESETRCSKDYYSPS